LKSLTDLKKSAQVGKVNSLQKYSNPLERELMNEMEEDLMAMFSEAVLNIEDEPKMKESD
jgi:hypothetical protein